MSIEGGFEDAFEQRITQRLAHYLQKLLIVLDKKFHIAHSEDNQRAQQIKVGLALKTQVYLHNIIKKSIL
jgi:hypothetical protein